MKYDPSNLTISAVLYITPTSDAKGLITAYDGTTLTEISPAGDTAAPGTLSTTTWP